MPVIIPIILLKTTAKVVDLSSSYIPVPLLSSELSELLLGKLLLLLGRLLLGEVGRPLQAISARYHSLSRDSRVTMPGISPFIPALCLSQRNAYYARNYARIIALSLENVKIKYIRIEK